MSKTAYLRWHVLRLSISLRLSNVTWIHARVKSTKIYTYFIPNRKGQKLNDFNDMQWHELSTKLFFLPQPGWTLNTRSNFTKVFNYIFLRLLGIQLVKISVDINLLNHSSEARLYYKRHELAGSECMQYMASTKLEKLYYWRWNMNLGTFASMAGWQRVFIVIKIKFKDPAKFYRDPMESINYICDSVTIQEFWKCFVSDFRTVPRLRIISTLILHFGGKVIILVDNNLSCSLTTI